MAEIAEINEQALVSVIAAAQKMGLSMQDIYECACKLTESQDSNVRFIDERATGDVAMAISLATARVEGLLK